MSDRRDAQLLLDYVRAVLRAPEGDVPSLDDLSEPFQPLGEELTGLIDRLQTERREFERTTYTDPLTELGNGRAAYRYLDELWAAGKTVAVASIDLDELKNYNAAYGHAEGDRFILEACRLLNAGIPGTHGVFRVSGDILMAVSEDLTVEQLEQALEDIRGKLIGRHQAQDYRRSFSFGCVLVDPSAKLSYKPFLEEAEERMYRYRYAQRVRAVEEQTGADGAFNLDGLTSRAFDAFAASDEKRYLFMCNMRTDVSRWSANAVRDFDLPGEYMADAGSIWAKCIHPDDREAYWQDVNAVFSGRKRTHNISYRARTRDGHYVVCTGRGYLLKDENDEPDFFAGSIINHGVIDNVDPVTNLYNVYRLVDELRAYKSEKKAVSLLVVSINSFRRINNTYGFEFGNKVLRRFAQLMLEQVRDRGRIFRLNSVKFCLLIDHQADHDEIEAAYQAIGDIVRSQLQVEGRSIRLTLSGGAVSFGRVDSEPTAVLSEMEYALSLSKKDGQGALVYFDDSRHSGARRQLELIDTLIRSVLLGDFRGFFLEYQPQVQFDGRIVGAEALVRWRDDTWGRVPPNDFIPVLENDSCFYELGLWILQTTLREVQPIVEKHPEFTISVNVSFRQLEQPSFKNDVLAIVTRMGFPTRNLTLELTEHCRSIQQSVLTENLHFLRAAGIRISADDFGTGYSSLALLRDLPLDCIKIDRTFISDIVENNPDQIIVKSTIQCAKDFGIHVCVEGVEDVPSLMTVDAFRPDVYQGYLYSKPISLEALLALFDVEGDPRIDVRLPEGVR